MFQHIVYSLANRQELFTYDRTCKTRLDTTTKFTIVETSLFNLVMSSFPENTFYHAWTWLLIYHDGSNNVVQICSFIKPSTVCSNMHEQACQQPCSSWPVQPCSSLSTGKKKLCVSTCVYRLKKIACMRVVARWDTRSWGSWRNGMSELNPNP